ncbi:hypothetical protein ABT336_01140 [Micromonospora sp. NPDC000207]|uniref:hypothetical protein n=1 Tax=Micromonospora sp. NPDC000207 TaxID=3154246 RepID=UPI0033344C9F
MASEMASVVMKFRRPVRLREAKVLAGMWPFSIISARSMGGMSAGPPYDDSAGLLYLRRLRSTICSALVRAFETATTPLCRRILPAACSDV